MPTTKLASAVAPVAPVALIALIALIALVAGACSFTAREPAPTALLGCASADDCAAGWSCSSSQQCLPPGIELPTLSWEIPVRIDEGALATLVPSTNIAAAELDVAELVI